MRHRIAGDADLDRLALWNHQLIEDERADNPMSVAELRERMRGFLAGAYRAVIFEDDAGGVGYALYRPDEYGMHLRQFFVERARRRQGLGRLAIRLLLGDALAKDQRVKVEVFLHNERAIAFWRAVGFADHTLALIAPTGSETPARTGSGS